MKNFVIVTVLNSLFLLYLNRRLYLEEEMCDEFILVMTTLKEMLRNFQKESEQRG